MEPLPELVVFEVGSGDALDEVLELVELGGGELVVALLEVGLSLLVGSGSGLSVGRGFGLSGPSSREDGCGSSVVVISVVVGVPSGPMLTLVLVVDVGFVEAGTGLPSTISVVAPGSELPGRAVVLSLPVFSTWELPSPSAVVWSPPPVVTWASAPKAVASTSPLAASAR
ncbi:hypothetical protein [Prauserella alba]|uniref:hypothetical protein n=1 Tax=Prauserella alba TaxID=176898 RepID=UPI0020A61738|nr:hypothetical protein [Prauserella alba]